MADSGEELSSLESISEEENEVEEEIEIVGNIDDLLAAAGELVDAAEGVEATDAEDVAETESLHSVSDIKTQLDLVKWLEKLEAGKKPKNLYYHDVDERRLLVHEDIREREKTSEKTLAQKAEAEKEGIELQLELSEKRLNELLSFGNDLVTNIKVANEKREQQRRHTEVLHREKLTKNMIKETRLAMAQFDNIVAKWSELKDLNEPVAIHEELEKQKERIEKVMKSKDELIAKCQEEVKRVSEFYNRDKINQANDICFLVERIDLQVELIREAYKEELKLLETTIVTERETMSYALCNKWESVYDQMFKHNHQKLDSAEEKERIYSKELERITNEQEAITRNTRVRLEKEAEMLQWELRNTKNNIFMNSEKLDYNYQILQKRNEENIIINNEQKRRFARLKENISYKKKKIERVKIECQNKTRKLTADIEKLHKNIGELQKKSEHFKLENKKKFDSVWGINFHETKDLVEKILEVDKILHEQQLGQTWTAPDLDFTDINICEKKHKLTTTKRTSGRSKVKKEKSDEVNKTFLRDIMLKLSDRAGFLVEEKLMEILAPYTEKEKYLVRIDNIFRALNITGMETVKSLTKYFMPYTYCPNCSVSVPKEALTDICVIDGQVEDVKIKPKKNKKVTELAKECKNHYMVLEPIFVLAALNRFTDDQYKRTEEITEQRKEIDSVDNLITLNEADIRKFWEKFPNYFPKEKMKLWEALDHGINHYVEVLKHRHQLNNECAFLRNQNAELHHLLQAFNL